MTYMSNSWILPKNMKPSLKRRVTCLHQQPRESFPSVLSAVSAELCLGPYQLKMLCSTNLQSKIDRSQDQVLIHHLKYQDSINAWLFSVESTLDNHINAYQTTLDIIHTARLGRLHPQLLSKDQLQKVLQEINDVNKAYEFPIPKDHTRAEKLSGIVYLEDYGVLAGTMLG